MLKLPEKWINFLIDKPESGMGYQIVTIILNNGEIFKQVVVQEAFITQIRGYFEIPFKEEDIAEIILTHDKWDFNAERKSRTK
jgi:hypothetical protein